MSTESTRRYRARKRGEDVPLLRPGPKQGYKQSPEHIARRKRYGAQHSKWKGNNIRVRSGRTRALRGFPIQSCELCGAGKSERHHKDGDTKNNTSANIQFLCRRCHMEKDGRLSDFKQLAKLNQPKAVAARWH